MPKQPKCMTPAVTTLIKLGSAIVHAQEALSKDGHEFDIAAFNKECSDPEVVEWLREMDSMAFLPKKRHG